LPINEDGIGNRLHTSHQKSNPPACKTHLP